MVGVREALNPPEARKVPERTRRRPAQPAAGPSRPSLPLGAPSPGSLETATVCAVRREIPGKEAGPAPCVWVLRTLAARSPSRAFYTHRWKQESAPRSKIPRERAALGIWLGGHQLRNSRCSVVLERQPRKQGHRCGFRRARGWWGPSRSLRTRSCPARELRRLQCCQTSALQRDPQNRSGAA